MTLEDIIKRNAELCDKYPAVTEIHILNEYWNGWITYEEYLKRIKEIQGGK